MGNYRGDYQDAYQDGAAKVQAKWNVTGLNPMFLVGGATVSRDMADDLVSRLGVTHVINVAQELVEEDERAWKKQEVKRFTVYWTPAQVDPIKDPADFLAAYDWMLGQVEKQLLRDECLPIFFIHCNAGIHRAPAMASFLMAAFTRCTLDKMVSYLYARRPFIELGEVPTLLTSAQLALNQVVGAPTTQGLAGDDAA